MVTDRKNKFFLPGPEIICLIFLVLFVVTAAPSLGWRDAPEFTNTTFNLGVAHPAGFPTYSLLSKGLTFLPIGSIAFRITIFSSLFAVFSIYILYRLVQLAVGFQVKEKSIDPVSTSFAATATVVVFGLFSGIWLGATETEVYILNLFFLAAICYAAAMWSASDDDSWIFTGAFLYGLAAGNHGTVAFYLPGFLIFFFIKSKNGTLRRLFLVAFFFLVGFTVYIYLPVRSMANPAIDWGNPETWRGFLVHITDRKDTNAHFDAVREGARFFTPIWFFLSETVPKAFWPLGLPLVLVGFWRMLKSNLALALGLPLLALSDIIFFIKWFNPAVFLPATFIFTVFWGVGLAFLLSKADLAHRFNRQALLALLLVVVFVQGSYFQFEKRDHSNMWLGLESFRDDLEAMEQDSIALTAILWFHYRAYQDIYRLREDVTVLGLSDFVKPQYFNPVTPARFPRIAFPKGSYDDKTGVRYLQKLIAANLDKDTDIYWEPLSLNDIFYPNLKPELDFLYKFTKQPSDSLTREEVKKHFLRIQSKLEKEIAEDGLLRDDELDAYHIDFMLETAKYLNLKKRPLDALALIDLVEGFFGPKGQASLPVRQQVYLGNIRGTSLLHINRIDQAEKVFAGLVELDRYNYDSWANLGMVYLKTGRLEKAKESLQQAILINPAYPEARYSLAQYFEKSGDRENAVKNYKLALSLADRSGIKSLIQKDLNKILEEESKP